MEAPAGSGMDPNSSARRKCKVHVYLSSASVLIVLAQSVAAQSSGKPADPK